MTQTLTEPEYLIIFETIDGSPCDLSGASRDGLAKHLRQELKGKSVQPYSVRVQGKNVARIERLNPPTPAQMVQEFHETYDHPVVDAPKIPSWEREELRVNLISEELMELEQAIDIPDNEAERKLVAVADALADLIYVTYGAALEYGIDLDAVVAEVHRSNMSKLGEDGKPIHRSDGKVLKGPHYSEPDLHAILFPEEGAA